MQPLKVKEYFLNHPYTNSKGILIFFLSLKVLMKLLKDQGYFWNRVLMVSSFYSKLTTRVSLNFFLKFKGTDETFASSGVFLKQSTNGFSFPSKINNKGIF